MKKIIIFFILSLSFCFLEAQVNGEVEGEPVSKELQVKEQQAQSYDPNDPPHIKGRKGTSEKNGFEKNLGGDKHLEVDNNDKCYSGYFNNSATGVGPSYGIYVQALKSDAGNPTYGIYSNIYNDDNSSPGTSPNYSGFFRNNSWGSSDAYAGYFDGSYLSTVPVGYGIYASASGATENWAGYFNGRVNITEELGIGTSAPAAKVHSKQVGIESAMIYENNGNGNDYWEWEVGVNDLNVYYDVDGAGPTARTYIAYVDDIDGSWNGLSDQSVKKDITAIEDGVLNKLLQVTPSSFRYIHAADDVQKTLGFIAQNVQAVLPEAVKTTEDGLLAMNYNDMAVLAVKAIQEQQIIIETLKTDNSKLKANNNAIQNELASIKTEIQSIKEAMNK